ncbi:hypothetical protein WA026_007933, partial [Henosepilachna vigintioctopunctata]
RNQTLSSQLDYAHYSENFAVNRIKGNWKWSHVASTINHWKLGIIVAQDMTPGAKLIHAYKEELL